MAQIICKIIVLSFWNHQDQFDVKYEADAIANLKSKRGLKITWKIRNNSGNWKWIIAWLFKDNCWPCEKVSKQHSKEGSNLLAFTNFLSKSACVRNSRHEKIGCNVNFVAKKIGCDVKSRPAISRKKMERRFCGSAKEKIGSNVNIVAKEYIRLERELHGQGEDRL